MGGSLDVVLACKGCAVCVRLCIYISGVFSKEAQYNKYNQNTTNITKYVTE